MPAIRPATPRVSTSGPAAAGIRRVYVDGAELVTVARVMCCTGPVFVLRLSRCPRAPRHHHASLSDAMREALDVAQLYVA